MGRRILDIVTSTPRFGDTERPTGLWLSELAHAWDVFDQAGFEQDVVSVSGGAVPIDPRSLEGKSFDDSARAWTTDPDKKALLASTKAVADIDPAAYDAIYMAGGHGAMYDFLDNDALHAAALAIWQAGGVVSAVCHGYCGLVDMKDADGGWFVNDRKLTGFSWAEEVGSGMAKVVPYDVEKLAKEHGARYRRAIVPFSDYTVVDGRLVTGENPASAADVAKLVAGLLG